jgi:hypothetical protein
MNTIERKRSMLGLELFWGNIQGEQICLDYASLDEIAHWRSVGFARSRLIQQPRGPEKMLGCCELDANGFPVKEYRCSDCKNEYRPDCQYKKQPEPPQPSGSPQS